MTPILPFINDTEENIRGLLEYCKEAKVYGILLFDIGGVPCGKVTGNIFISN